MDWFLRKFLRKSLRVSPLRLNFSKRGLGASVGAGTGQSSRASGEAGRRAVGQPRAPRSRPWRVVVVLALAVGSLLTAVLVGAGETTRIDFFDTKGRRTGYAVVDRDTGRVDFYDTMSRRTGYGRVDGAGKAERFGLDGNRQGEIAVPVLPKGGHSR
jgi:hypothetical protein